jgi:DNA-binding response OmpR family regulator
MCSATAYDMIMLDMQLPDGDGTVFYVRYGVAKFRFSVLCLQQETK